ncbi:MAG: Uma2 family endonuclease [Isosphaeraceae bacterium]
MSLTTAVPTIEASAPDSSPPVLVEAPLPSYLSHPYRLTVAQYDRMVETGILGEDDRVELIEGILVAKVGRNRPHIVSGKKSLRSLERIVPPNWHVSKEDPATVSNYSKPKPDLSVVRGQPDDYIEQDVTGADIGLAVEVSETTLRTDQQEKKRIYAASRIPYYWIINLVKSQVEVYSDPDGPDYRTVQVFTRDQEVPVILDGAEVGRIHVADLLPVS